MKDTTIIDSNQPTFQTEEGIAYDIPEEGSLGLLALGYVGLMAWREKRNALQQERKQVKKK